MSNVYEILRRLTRRQHQRRQHRERPLTEGERRSRARRLAAEQKRLAEDFPGFQWIDPTSNTRVVGTVLSSTGREYEITLRVPDRYPIQRARLFISNPTLYDRDGNVLDGASHAMHILERKADGLEICYARNWPERSTLRDLVERALIWLNTYELYQLSGKPLCAFI